MASMNDLLNRLVGLCAGRGALLSLERVQLLREFKSFPDNHDDLDEHQSNYQLCVNSIGTSVHEGKDSERRSSFEPGEQLSRSIEFRHRPETLRPNERIEIFDPYELLRTVPIPTHMRSLQAQQQKSHTVLPVWSREHKKSSPPTVLLAPSVLSYSNPYKIGQGYHAPAKRVTDVNSNEALSSVQKCNAFLPAVTDTRNFHVPAIMRHTDTRDSHQNRSTTFVCLDHFEADMRILTIKLIRESRLRREIVLLGPENKYRVRVEVDATSTSTAELEQARQSTTFRADYGLLHQFPDAGRVDMYERVRHMKSRI